MNDAEALEALKAEFRDLGVTLGRAAPRDPKTGARGPRDRWVRLVEYLQTHPGEEVLIETVHANAAQRLRNRFPKLVVVSERNRFEDLPEGSTNKRGRKVCDLRLEWPADDPG